MNIAVVLWAAFGIFCCIVNFFDPNHSSGPDWLSRAGICFIMSTLSHDIKNETSINGNNSR